jgi:serine/threonine protein kinase
MGGCAGVSCCQPPECCLRACISGFAALSFLPQGKEFHVDYEGGRARADSPLSDVSDVLSRSTSASSVCGDSPVLSPQLSPKLGADSAEASGATADRKRKLSRKKKTVSWDEEELEVQKANSDGAASPTKDYGTTDPLSPPVRGKTDPLPAKEAVTLPLPSHSQSVPDAATSPWTPSWLTPSRPGRVRTGSIFNRLRVSSNMHDQLQEDALVNSKKKHAQRLLKWKVRGKEKPIWEFYEMVSTLGTGAFGTVQKWRLKQVAHDENPDVAVKHIRWSDISGGILRSKEAEKVVRNELKMLLVLDHPFIVKFREWFEHPCLGIFFVMDLCTGRPLQLILEDVCHCESLQERLTHTARLRRYFREIVYAVSYIHSFKPPVVHRDLKPENVLLQDESASSCVKIIDFGLAVDHAHSSNHGHGVWQQGTPAFMAPETFTSKEGQFTPEMDVWALGIIFGWTVTALQRGRLLHPMLLLKEDGEGYEVGLQDLFYAYRNERSWNRELFEGQDPSAFDLADLILVHDSSARPKAAHILRADWVRSGDPAAAASAQVLRNANFQRNLETYAELTSLEKTILHVVAEKASDSDVKTLRRTFRAMDTNGDGRLCRSEIMEGFRSNGVELQPRTLEALFAELDDDKTDDITYHEWLAATMCQRVLQAPTAVGSAFSALDTSGNGMLTFEDLEVAIGPTDAEEVLKNMSTAHFEDNPALSFQDFKAIVAEMVKRRHGFMRTSTSLFSSSMSPNRSMIEPALTNRRATIC